MQSIFPLPPKKISFCYFHDQNWVQNKKKQMLIPFTLLDHVCCLLLLRTWVSTQIMVCDCCIAKCKNVSACGRLLMALWAISFLIKNI